MEVIKIPWEHVDACLFFRPGSEGGDLLGQHTVIISTTATEKRDVTVDDGWKKTDEGGVQT